MDTFTKCHEINELLKKDQEHEARNELIKLLDYYLHSGLEYTPLINHLIRQTGLFPYMDMSTSSWQDRYVYEIFKADIGESKKITLHREQSFLLKKLLSGKDIAVSAPTSFGKSFVIYSFISIKRPKNVVIIVPTIALTDETRRNLYKKFSKKYKIITTPDAELSTQNIFIFPQERAISYVNKIDNLDILIIDEFYKASPAFDKERSPTLLRAIISLGNIAKQRYFLAPNITELKNSVFTTGMEFHHLDFNTVFLEKHDLYLEIGKDEKKKSQELMKILSNSSGKSLIYAGTFSNIDKVSSLLIKEQDDNESQLVIGFQEWLAKNYSPNWYLTQLVGKGSGVHNGRLHRSLSQIQIKLFEEDYGLKNIISTSSIIEGVNTSAENVVLWSNLSGRGRARIDDFSYKNIIGRSGRMLKHFIGKIYILEEPPAEVNTQLELTIPDGLLGHITEERVQKQLTTEQVAKVFSFKNKMSKFLGEEQFARMQEEGAFQSSDSDFILKIATKLNQEPVFRENLKNLNIPDSNYWDNILYEVLKFDRSYVWGRHTDFIGFVKILQKNWELTIPELLFRLKKFNITIEELFNMERIVTFRLASVLTDINTIQLHLKGKKSPDISIFISKVSHAFLPTVVYQLEEYGLPRMISRKIHQSGLLDFTESDTNIHEVIDKINVLGKNQILGRVKDLDRFDEYILDYFFNGISGSEKTLKN